MGLVHYLADLPRCWGECHHGQGRAPCASPDLCAGASAAMADAAAQCRRQLRAEPELMGARMGMACAETTQPADIGPEIEPWHLPHYGYTGAPRIPRRPLNVGSLDRRIEDKASRPMPLPELLLAKGAMTAHPAPTWMERLRTAWLSFRIRRLGRL